MININKYIKITMAILLPVFNMECAMHNSNMQYEEDRSSPTNVVDIVIRQKRKYSADMSEFAPDFYKRQCNEEPVIINNLVFFEDDQATLEEVTPSVPKGTPVEALDYFSTLPSPGSKSEETAGEEMEVEWE